MIIPHADACFVRASSVQTCLHSFASQTWSLFGRGTGTSWDERRIKCLAKKNYACCLLASRFLYAVRRSPFAVPCIQGLYGESWTGSGMLMGKDCAGRVLTSHHVLVSKCLSKAVCRCCDCSAQQQVELVQEGLTEHAALLLHSGKQCTCVISAQMAALLNLEPTCINSPTDGWC